MTAKEKDVSRSVFLSHVDDERSLSYSRLKLRMYDSIAHGIAIGNGARIFSSNCDARNYGLRFDQKLLQTLRCY